LFVLQKKNKKKYFSRCHFLEFFDYDNKKMSPEFERFQMRLGGRISPQIVRMVYANYLKGQVFDAIGYIVMSVASSLQHGMLDFPSRKARVLELSEEICKLTELFVLVVASTDINTYKNPPIEWNGSVVRAHAVEPADVRGRSHYTFSIVFRHIFKFAWSDLLFRCGESPDIEMGFVIPDRSNDYSIEREIIKMKYKWLCMVGFMLKACTGPF
jgi:hypothetical protein